MHPETRFEAFSLRCAMRRIYMHVLFWRKWEQVVLQRNSVGKNLSFEWKLWIEPAVPVDCQEVLRGVIEIIWSLEVRGKPEKVK